MSKINNDELGAMGEGHFAAICAGGRLIANQAHRDRAGWDFIVEHPIQHDESSDLDIRANPISTIFQVKSLKKNSHQIKFRLSSIERLAKETRPSFVYIMTYDEHEVLDSTHIIHMRGDILAVVLKKLRKLRSQGNTPTNKSTITIKYKKYSEELSPSGLALKKYIEDCVGQNAEEYSKSKSSELKTIGYDEFSHQLTISFDAKNQTELLDVLWGDRPVEPSSVTLHETRFGIKIETPEGRRIKEIKFSPFSLDDCTIRVRVAKEVPTAQIAAKFYGMPLNLGLKAFKIKSDIVQMIYVSNEFRITTPHMSSVNDFMKIDQWIDYFVLLLAMSTEGATIQISPKRAGTKPINIKITEQNVAQNGYKSDQILPLIHLFDRLRMIFSAIRETDTPLVSVNSVAKQKNLIEDAYNCTCPDFKHRGLEIRSVDNVDNSGPDNLTAIVILRLILNERILAWYYKSEMLKLDHRPTTTYVSSSMEAGECRLLDKSDYDAFAENFLDEGLQSVVVVQDLETGQFHEVQPGGGTTKGKVSSV